MICRYVCGFGHVFPCPVSRRNFYRFYQSLNLSSKHRITDNLKSISRKRAKKLLSTLINYEFTGEGLRKCSSPPRELNKPVKRRVKQATSANNTTRFKSVPLTVGADY